MSPSLGLEAKTSYDVCGQVGEVGGGVFVYFYMYVQMCSPTREHMETGSQLLVSSITSNLLRKFFAKPRAVCFC